ncbi:DNA-binding protein SMUBP-2 [Chlorella vulgaris]
MAAAAMRRNDSGMAATMEGLVASMGSLNVRGGASGGGSKSRSNVGRVPQLDYFARQMTKRDPGKVSIWSLSFGKAGQAAGLPDVHASVQAYLSSMQAHTALEFQAAAAAALKKAEGPYREPEQEWWRFDKGRQNVWWALATRRKELDFSDDGDPWGKHLVQVMQTDSYHIAITAALDQETRESFIVLLPEVQAPPGVLEVEMRSLGYLGSFLLQYSSAQTLRFKLHSNTLPPSARHCLELAADPRRQLQPQGNGMGTLRGGSYCLLTNKVPINASQRAAVVDLRGGLNIIHGRPGTGKSTTIFHIIESRVQKRAKVLVTCSRNQAVDAVVGKLALVEGELLVFGREERLGETAKRFTLDARISRDPTVAACLDNIQMLQAMRDDAANQQRNTAKLAARGRSLLAEALAIAAASVPAEELTRLQRLLEGCVKRPHCRLVDETLQPAIDILLAKVLPAIKSAAQLAILRSTRVYACTIDSTPGMVRALDELQVDVDIDTVIVDEAGCVAEMALPTLINLAPSNLVLVGDHLQLPAYTDCLDPPPNHIRSFMARAYRMHPSICAAISNEFYGGRVRTAPATAARRALSAPCRVVNVHGLEKKFLGGGYIHHREAKRAIKAACTAVMELRALGMPQPTVFVISMYNRQRDLLEQLMGKEAQLKANCTCQVLSIDSCQGDEADAVVLSTVRNVAGPSPYVSSFFRDRRRVNVAMSRARHLCMVVCSIKTLRLPKAQPWGAVLANYHCVDHSA